jgi:aldose 1-epimerase
VRTRGPSHHPAGHPNLYLHETGIVAKSSIERAPFGTLPSGEAVERFTLRSGEMEVGVSEYGGAILSLRVPDRDGRMADVVLGFDRLDDYVADQKYFGALIGRYANRIAGARFSLDGREYLLPVNNGANHLHGGPNGFHKVVWAAEPFTEDGGTGIRLVYDSPDGEEGYPGTLRVEVVYRLAGDGALEIGYAARTDRPTPVNLTQHTYFNLTGDPSRDVVEHELQLDAGRITPVDEGLIPTGELAPVDGTPFDFRTPVAIGARIGAPDPRLRQAGGYDHNFVLSHPEGVLGRAARVREPRSGRVLEVHTTEPGLQLYSGNYLDGTAVGKGGVAYAWRSGLCLEPQHFPDSPNQPAFPGTILRPGERYASRTVWRFGVDD